jgi:vacuolar-type H+-ATPase subunit H
VAARVESVLAAAERAAADIRRDAEEWAQRHIDDSRRRAEETVANRVQELSTVTQDLLERARSIAERSDELISALDDAGRRAVRAPRPQPEYQDGRETDRRLPETDRRSRVPETSWEQAPPSPPAATPSPPVPVRGSDPSGAESARLLATQMAVAGSSRESIASRLRDELGIADPHRILDELGI